MYCEYFEFTEKPFNITPNPRFFFLSKSHKELFASLLDGIAAENGFFELTGEVGTGKTTIIRALLEQLDESAFRTALIFNPRLSAAELLRSINREFGISADLNQISDLQEELIGFLLEENRQGRTVVLVIDEAQNLDIQVMEQIRLLADLKTETGSLVRIILAGQPELVRLLALPELSQLVRIRTLRLKLLPMDLDDTRSYIMHRLKCAGGAGKAEFAPAAVQEIFRYSGGLPRLINIACERAILVAFTGDSRKITLPMARTAIQELSTLPGGIKPAITITRSSANTVRIAGVVVGVILIAFFAGRVLMLDVKAEARKEPARVSSPQPANRTGPVKPAVTAELPLTAAQPQSAPIQEKLLAPLSPPGRVSLASLTENHNVAINAVARLWNMPPVNKVAKDSFPNALANCGLDHTPFNGKISYLARLDTPAIIEIKLPNRQGVRYVALTGVNNGKLVTVPPLPGGMDRSEFEKQWSGRGYLLWKNHQKIPVDLKPGATGIGVLRLQILLIGAGTLKREPSGVIDESTVEAIQEFQQKKGLKADGRPGALTLMLLYRDGGRLHSPVLTGTARKS